jgi:ribose transport system substrate-binding protein
LKKICPTCKSRTIIVPINDWASKIAPNVNNALIADSKVDFVIGMYDAMQDQILLGIKQANRPNVGTGSYNGVTAVIKRIQDGQNVKFTVGESADQVAYWNMDQALRILSGVAPVKDPATPYRYFDATNAKDAGVPPKESTGYGTDYKAGFASLWGK